jgi:23S rRNA pseudouridine1911/1915/1917 synthase
MNIPCVYEDQWLAVFDKPAGLLSVAAPDEKRRNLTDVLDQHARETGLAYRFHPCHRLDRETSGVIIFAKGKAAQQAVMELFRSRLVKKTYLAFVQGHLGKDKGTISSPVKGEQARTDYRLIERRKDFSVVEVAPQTGRTNQIRIHFKSIGHPLVGESTFAFRKDFALKAKRACLHAESIEFKHPWTGACVKARAPLPADMQKFMGEHR